MSYKLSKPYTAEDKDEFIFKYNQDCFQEGYHCRIEETENALFALEANEIIVDGEAIINPNYEHEQEELEKERINNLRMTALDFIGVLKSLGLTAEQIREYLNNNADLDLQLKCCDRVYCGVVQALCPLTINNVTLTKEMVIHAFKVKNGEA